jgi:hypothetical protein
MPTKVMRPQVDSNQLPGFYHHHPGCLIGNRKNPFIRILAFFRRIITESVGHLLRNKHDFVFLTAFGFSQDQFSVLNINQSEFQYLTDPHTSSSHQFKNQPITNFDRSEYDLVNGLFFDDFPSGNHPFPVQFSDHGRIARITHGGIDVISEKIEKGRQVGIADSFCVGFVTVGKAVQKGKDIIGGNLINLTITEILAEPINDGLI